MPPSPPKLLDQVRQTLRQRSYAYRTEKAYLDWIKRYILFHKKLHPKQLDGRAVVRFLTYLAVEKDVAASTQNQAFSAILFLYRDVLQIDLELPKGLVRAKKPKRLPTVLSKDEASTLLRALTGVHQLMAQLLYGSGLRVMECARLRVKDLDFDQNQLLVRNSKGLKDRATVLPEALHEPLVEHLERVAQLHAEDLANGFGRVFLPYALSRKYPHADREWIWQFVFPSNRLSEDPRDGTTRRHHRSPSAVQRAIRQAARRCGIDKHVTPHTLRHSFATHVLQNGYDIRTVQELLGHKDVRTTMTYTHVIKAGPFAVRSPLDE